MSTAAVYYCAAVSHYHSFVLLVCSYNQGVDSSASAALDSIKFLVAAARTNMEPAIVVVELSQLIHIEKAY